jgi:MFS family permease
MFWSYRALLRRAGVPALAVACGLAWLSFQGYTFAIILAVHAARGSFAVAGGVVAAFSAGGALVAPARGRFIDTRGPRSLQLFAAAHACWAGTLVAGCALRAGPPILLACGALAGVSAPPLIATARSVFGKLAGPDLAPAAHALNAALADAAQLLSPALVGALAALLSSSATLAGLVAGATGAGVLIARAGRTVESAASQRVSHHALGALQESAGLRTLVACDVLLGAWTGGFEVAATAIATRSGAAALSAVPLSATAAGSLVISLWSGTGQLRRSAAWRYLAGCLLVGAVFPLTLLVPSIAGLASIAVIVGVGYALLNVALFELLDCVVTADRPVEAFTWLTTGNAAGTAVGAASAGQLAHTHDSAALLLTSSCAALVAAVALVRHQTLRAEPAAHMRCAESGPESGQ